VTFRCDGLDRNVESQRTALQDRQFCRCNDKYKVHTNNASHNFTGLSAKLTLQFDSSSIKSLEYKQRELLVNREICSRNEQGQLSIFLGISMLIVVTFIAFIVNIGLFVKAKINLQNAVDASAWSGAAVQARQLSNIGYLNWEMRNIYKEWMFKYYVLGHLSLNKTNLEFNESQQETAGRMSFRRNNFGKPGQSFFDPKSFDKYNSPSICIAFDSENNICDTYRVPGLPRFETLGDPGVSEHHEAALNKIVSEKSKDCTDRSKLNASVANIWAYGTKNNNFPAGVQIAAHRPGAWTKAIELAFRMRNLEMIVNRPPVSEPICAGGDVLLASNVPG